MKALGPIPSFFAQRPWVYRFESLDRLFEILEKKQLTFVRPSLWSDPLENIIFNANLIRKGKPYQHPGAEKIYGQCWSLEGDSYALWQIYTTKMEKGEVVQVPGVRITTFIDKLSMLSRLNQGRFYYGFMQYKSLKYLQGLKNDSQFIKGLQSEIISEEHLKTLLVKRRSYGYESEFRLLSVPNELHIDPNRPEICRFDIDPQDFISSIQFDPRMKRTDFLHYRKILSREWGFRSTQIKQSTLGMENPFRFVLD